MLRSSYAKVQQLPGSAREQEIASRPSSRKFYLVYVALVILSLTFVVLLRAAAIQIDHQRWLVEVMRRSIAMKMAKAIPKPSEETLQAIGEARVAHASKKQDGNVVCNGIIVNSVEACSIKPDKTQVNNIIQAGFSTQQAEMALRAVGNENCCSEQIKFLHDSISAQNRELYSSINMSEDDEANVLTRRCPKRSFPECCHMSEHTDYDGIAVIWGAQNIQPTAEDCCQSCRDYVPKAPHFYPCNVWVYCPYKKDSNDTDASCFAPAAGVFTVGQCWLKYQDNPTEPRVNMRGKYTEEYLKRHPSAPAFVDWTAGLIIEESDWELVTNGTWSPRSGW